MFWMFICSFAEWAVFCHFVTLALLWLTRDPGFVSGWNVAFKDGLVNSVFMCLSVKESVQYYKERQPFWMLCGFN